MSANEGLIELLRRRADDEVYFFRYAIDAEYGAWVGFGGLERLGYLHDDRIVPKLLAVLNETRGKRLTDADVRYCPSDEEHAQHLSSFDALQIKMTEDDAVVVKKMRRAGNGWVGSSQVLELGSPLDRKAFGEAIRRLLE